MKGITKTLVNVSHPGLGKSVANKTRVWQLEKTVNVTVRRICQRYPDNKVDVPVGQEALSTHDRLVFQHPFYWYPVPPLMKQWMDEAFTYGWAYGGGNTLTGKEWVYAISIGGSADSYQTSGYNSYPMSKFLKPPQQTANLVQTKLLSPFISHSVVHTTEAEIGQSARELAAHITDPLLDPRERLAALVQAMNDKDVSLQSAYLIFIEPHHSRTGGNGSSR